MKKVEYCKELLRTTQRPNIEGLIEFITDLGYFIAPGSMKHHRYKGGLVIQNLERICSINYFRISQSD